VLFGPGVTGITIGATANAQYRPGAGQIRVELPIGGTGVAGTYTAALRSSTMPSLNQEIMFGHIGGAITRGPLVWTLEHDEVDVEGLGLTVEITVETVAPAHEIPYSPRVQGIRARGTATVRDGLLSTSMVMDGTAVFPGSFRVRLEYDGTEFDSRSIRLAAGQEGRTFASMVAVSNIPGVVYTAGSYNFDITRLRIVVTFIPDITSDVVNNVSAEGRIFLLDGNEGSVLVTLASPRVGVEGFYTVRLTGQGFRVGTLNDLGYFVPGEATQTTRFPAFASVHEAMSFDIVVDNVDQFATSVGLTLTHHDGNDFFYVMNFAAETISFGGRFTVRPEQHVMAWTEHNGVYAYRVQKNPDGSIQTEMTEIVDISRAQITYTFNRRADRVVPRIRYHANPARAEYRTLRDVRWSGTWSATDTGEVDISRQLRRGGFMGVRKTVDGVHTMLAVIEIPARPDNRALRAERRNIYLPTVWTAADGVNNREFLQNPITSNVYNRHGVLLYTPTAWEIRLLGDRGFVHREVLRTEFIKPGEKLFHPHDRLPRNSRTRNIQDCTARNKQLHLV